MNNFSILKKKTDKKLEQIYVGCNVKLFNKNYFIYLLDDNFNLDYDRFSLQNYNEIIEKYEEVLDIDLYNFVMNKFSKFIPQSDIKFDNKIFNFSKSSSSFRYLSSEDLNFISSNDFLSKIKYFLVVGLNKIIYVSKNFDFLLYQKFDYINNRFLEPNIMYGNFQDYIHWNLNENNQLFSFFSSSKIVPNDIDDVQDQSKLIQFYDEEDLKRLDSRKTDSSDNFNKSLIGIHKIIYIDDNKVILAKFDCNYLENNFSIFKEISINEFSKIRYKIVEDSTYNLLIKHLKKEQIL